jgi:hypothetical protein
MATGLRLTIADGAAVATLLFNSSRAAGQDPAPGGQVEDALIGRGVSESVALLTARLAQAPDDQQARFALGIAQFLASQEALFQELYTYGFLSRAQMLMFIAPGPAALVPNNPDPAEIDHDTFNGIIESWLTNVAAAEKTLAQITAEDVSLHLRVGLMRMDLDNSGDATENEALWRLFAAAQRRQPPTAAEAEQFIIAFDRGDANWLRGYCHLLMAAGNALLAYDTGELFNRTGHFLFAKPKTPYAYLQEPPPPGDPQQMMVAQVVDVVALVHLINFPLKDAERMERSLHHLQRMLENAREMWKHYNNETDNDREWVPNPRQECIFPDVQVTDEMQQAWLTFLDEAEEALRGERLVPFWRPAGGRGVNLRRVFTEPRAFDLILWVQGTAADPYLEEGRLMTPGLVRQMQTAFNNRFFSYAAWFN